MSGTAFRDWHEEIRQTANAMFGQRALRPALVLTDTGALDDRLPRGMSRARLAAHLAAGILNVTYLRCDADKRFYRITTEKYDLMVCEEPSNANPRIRIVIPTRVADARTDWRKPTEPLVPSSVRFAVHWEPQGFDIDLLVEECRRRRDAAEAVSGLTKVKITPRRQSALRAATRRDFGSLRALLELMRERAEQTEATGADGTVVPGSAVFADPPPDTRLVVRLSRWPDFDEHDGARLQVRRRQDTASEPVDYFLVDRQDTVVVLHPAQGVPTFSPGDTVRLGQREKFTYQRHQRALSQFLDSETVVGSWTSLAMLLCEPTDLVTRPRALEPRAGGRPLNPRQEEAVAGALTSPHAYFIQGPPGTGKSHVIAELIDRLVARGERVLFTASSHVAVDEVLGRVAEEHDPGVLPVRLSYSDALVAQESLPFTPRAYLGKVTEDVRIPATSRIGQWEAELAELTGDRFALVVWRDALAEYPTAVQRVTSTSAELETAIGAAGARAAELTAQETRLMAAYRQAQDVVDTCSASLGFLASRIEHLAVHRSVFGRIADRLGIGALARTTRDRQQAEEAWRAATAGRLASAQQLAAHRDLAARLEAATRQSLGQLRQRLETDRRRLAESTARRDTAGAILTERGLADLAFRPVDLAARIASLGTERDTLAARIGVQRRWFTLCGTTGDDERADRRQAAGAVSGALWTAANLVCSTTTGIAGSRDFYGLDYDTLIVDEASRATVAEFLIPAVRARRWILVGDEHQLPPYVTGEDEHHIHAMAAIAMTERAANLPLKQAADQLNVLWSERDDHELHPFRAGAVREKAAQMLASGLWDRVHRRTFHDQLAHIRRGEDPERTLLQAMDNHLVRSLFETSVARVDETMRTRMLEQWRMPGSLAEVVKGPVYGGDYLSPPGRRRPAPLLSPSFPTPIVFLDTSAQPDPWDVQSHTTFYNELEATWVVEACRRWNNDLAVLGIDERVPISILSFYKAQAELIRQELGAPGYPGLDRLTFRVVDSIDRLQGQESDIVILSFCRTHGKPKGSGRATGSRSAPPVGYARWLQNINRLNVACTRARRSLVLVGHGTTLRRLQGVPRAESFYTNLFGLPSDVLTVRKEFLAGRSNW